ncbi:poly [ADP-ribose] polymerase [Condylostylus longicornis]|uniref:poly [ADP-ribose] polymerase n=1 Tax=Condylostylus longicornis TaxID=2530218 RepID=UPI00244DDA58|nr:poly [ADP-ribose] polymerase [Condylostylus longicornis]
MDIDEKDLPFKIEYAKTGRASCKGCKTGIGQGSLRLAVMVQSWKFDGKQPNWYHEHCFFNKQRPGSEGDIANFNNIKLADQKRIREKISELGGAAVVMPKSGKGKKRSAAEIAALKDFGVEYSKSSRATCRGCEQIITKGDVRIQKTVFDTEVGAKYGGQPLWHHVDCFVQCRNDLGYFESGEFLPGFGNLSKEDQKLVKEKLKKVKQEEIPEVKKAKLEPKDEAADAEFEKNLEKQQKIYDKYYEVVTKVMTKNDCLDLLAYNSQEPVANDTGKLFNQVADMLAFGALKPCTVCNSGQLHFNKTGYLCNGNLTEWTKCATFVKEPEKLQCKIPDHIKEKYKKLQKYKEKPTIRLVKYVAPSAATLVKLAKKEEDLSTGPKVKRERPPLYNFKVAIHGLKDEEDKIKKLVEKLGGSITKSINEKTTIIISEEKEVEKMGKKMLKAKELGIHIVPVEYLHIVKEDNTGAISFISSKTLCDWGTDPSPRLAHEEQLRSENKSKSMYTKSIPKSVTLKLKGGSAVDPDSGLQDSTHVYKKGDNIYNAVLGLTDIQKNKNSYYKVQVLESDHGHQYFVFRSWGRIGTTIGGTKLESCNNLLEALHSFEVLYKEKTGNDFYDRHNFQKIAGFMYPIDVDYGNEETAKLNTEHHIKSKLPTPVQDLIKLIFDVDAMKKVMLEFDLDMDKMPLGKLSQKQIQNAYKVLTELSKLISEGGTNSQFIDATNRYYTLIPHNFGVNNPPILDTAEQIKHHSDTLDNLLEIEFAYNLIKGEKGKEGEKDSEVNPIDKHYEQLNTEMEPLDKNSEEFETLCKYVQNTHAETHRMYDLEVVDIFKVVRKGELRRFKPFKKLHNRKLLWHGSRLTNFAGILSHGLKIAPPEAPSTGYMFGKGIYFADMSSKSANYCFTSKQNNVGLMLLSEVALGDMYELTNANYITNLPKNKHSCKGVGRTHPNPKESIFREDGVEIPLGKPITDDKLKSSLLYNEYIVYDVAQVNVQYLLKLSFNYKY